MDIRAILSIPTRSWEGPVQYRLGELFKHRAHGSTGPLPASQREPLGRAAVTRPAEFTEADRSTTPFSEGGPARWPLGRAPVSQTCHG